MNNKEISIFDSNGSKLDIQKITINANDSKELIIKDSNEWEKIMNTTWTLKLSKKNRLEMQGIHSMFSID